MATALEKQLVERIEGERSVYENARILEEKEYAADEIAKLALAVGAKECVACDFEVKKDSGEKAIPIGELLTLAGFEVITEGTGVRIANIDHHYEHSGLYSQVSSAHLAARYVELFGLQTDLPVFINHPDADSLIALAILLGKVSPEERLLTAVISADHTGEENFIADILQASETDKGLSLNERMEMLFNLASGRLYDVASLFDVLPNADAQIIFEEYAARHYSRTLLENLTPKFSRTEHEVYYLEIDRLEIPDTTFLVSARGLEGAVVACVSRTDEETGNQIVRVRLGKKGMERGLNLFETAYKTAGVTKLEGRWNAGGNKRAGGCDKSIEEVAKLIDETLS